MSETEPNNIDSPTVEQEQPITTTSKKRKTRQLKSDVWNDFTKIIVDGISKAKCNHCGVEYMNRPKDGTTNLCGHLKLKHPSKVKQDVRHMLIAVGEKRRPNDNTTDIKSWNFDQELSKRDLARMVILHEYPFALVDHAGFREFVRNLQPLFKMVSRTTIKKDCIKIFEEEKEKLYSLLDTLTSRISLTSDMWTSNQNKGYMSY